MASVKIAKLYDCKKYQYVFPMYANECICLFDCTYMVWLGWPFVFFEKGCTLRLNPSNPEAEGFKHTSGFLHHFVMGELATSSIRVKDVCNFGKACSLCPNGINIEAFLPKKFLCNGGLFKRFFLHFWGSLFTAHWWLVLKAFCPIDGGWSVLPNCIVGPAFYPLSQGAAYVLKRSLQSGVSCPLSLLAPSALALPLCYNKGELCYAQNITCQVGQVRV